VTLLLVALASGAAGAALAWLVLLNRQSAVAERLRLREAAARELAGELAAERAARSELLARNSGLAAELAAERAGSEARMSELRNAHERLKGEFAELSTAALRANRDDFMKLAQQAFTQLHEKSTGEFAGRQQAIDSLVKPLRESLEKVDAKIVELEQRRERAYGDLGRQLESLNSAQLRFHTEATRLASALSATKTAGTWGEVQLRRVVELSGLTEHCDFAEQVTPVGGDRDRADLVVYLPDGQQIVVDAKAPTDSYREASAETDGAKRAVKLSEHAAKVRVHIDAIGGREYWTKFQPSPEFVVLFLPGDQFLSAAIEADPTLMDRAIGKKVLLATPATLIALLKAAAYGWRQEAVSKSAEEVSALGRQLYDRIANFADHLDRVGRGLDGAVKSYNAAVGSFEQNLLPGSRRFNELGAKGAKELTSPAGVETGVRDIAKKS